MADNYIEYIANGLKKLYPELSSQGFIQYVDNGLPFTLTGYNEQIDWSWDDFFIALAWQGLESSKVPENERYNIDAWEKLSDQEKSIINQYQGFASYESNKCN